MHAAIEAHVPLNQPPPRAPSRRWSDMALLETRGLTVTYGGLHANENIDLDVEAGKLVGLIGPNGAGKTTFIDAITGFTHVSAGTVELRRRRPRRQDARPAGPPRAEPHVPVARAVRGPHGARQPARRRRAPALVLVPRRHGAARAATSGPYYEQVDRALDVLGLERARRHVPERPQPRPAQADRRGPGAGRRPEAGPARRAGRRPRHRREPAARRPPAGVPRRSGMSVFLIDHDMGLVLNVCDYIYVLDFGRSSPTARRRRCAPTRR